MGPTALNDHENIDIGPHPHIGLSTLTYLFEGSILHKDSLGFEVEIKPGQVNWMTAGRGIVHSERTPEYLRHTDKHLHGLQIWVALPKALEQMPPSFFHAEEQDIPQWEEHGISYKLIAGAALGKRSPVPVYSNLFFLEIKNTTPQRITIGKELVGEVGLYILEGNIESEGITYEPKRILVAKDSALCEFTLMANSTVYLFGGEAFPEERFIYWNFVATDKALLEVAKQKWLAQEFPAIKGETGFIPLPQ
jgi:redox-sensitive bicupin YhaK (pirin superfamily)